MSGEDIDFECAPGSSAAFTPNKRKILVLRINRGKFYIVLLLSVLSVRLYCLSAIFTSFTADVSPDSPRLILLLVS